MKTINNANAVGGLRPQDKEEPTQRSSGSVPAAKIISGRRTVTVPGPSENTPGRQDGRRKDGMAGKKGDARRKDKLHNHAIAAEPGAPLRQPTRAAQPTRSAQPVRAARARRDGSMDR